MTIALVAIASVLALWSAWAFWQYTRVEVELVGLASGDAINAPGAENLALEFVVPADRVATAGLRVDGEDVRRAAERSERGLMWEPREPLSEGEHTIELSVDRPVLPDAAFRWTFVVDTTPPALPLPAIAEPVAADDQVRLAGRVGEGEELWLDGEAVPLSGDGDFELVWDHAPIGPPMELRVVDAAGNEAIGQLSVPIELPEIRGLHLTATDWADPAVQARVLELIDEGSITAVEIDLKDEYGFVGFETDDPEVVAIGADHGIYDLADAVDLLHEHGAHVVGRLVAFNDPLYAQAAWDRGDRDQVVQTTDGEMLARNEGLFLNFANPDVRDYVSRIALAAADAGIDDVLLDYVRRPDGDLDGMHFEGLEGTPEQGVVEFLAELQPELRARGAVLGASVFGIAARAPTDIGQDVPEMANYLDYVAPMVYPSHFAADNYNVADPNSDPYTIVARVLPDFQQQVADRGIPLVPWLQDFSSDGVDYDSEKVRAQIDAACANGIVNHLLWNPRSSYTSEALGACP